MNIEIIRVVVNGALGKMGQEVIKAVISEPGMKIVGATEKEANQQYLPLSETLELVLFSSDLDFILHRCQVDVVVDFTNAQVSMETARIALKQKINMVIGTTGLSEENLAEIAELCQVHGVGAIVAPNFSLGAALSIHLCKVAANFFNRAEIIEMHHDNKIDAPSGTAITTASAMSKARREAKPTQSPFGYHKAEKEIISGTRGGQLDGIAIHSLRLPGFIACQEVIFSGAGETLSLRHEAISRECYMPGVVLAIKEVLKHKGLIYGLDTLLDMKWKDSM